MEYGRDEVEEREDSACGDMNEDAVGLSRREEREKFSELLGWTTSSKGSRPPF